MCFGLSGFSGRSPKSTKCRRRYFSRHRPRDGSNLRGRLITLPHTQTSLSCQTLDPETPKPKISAPSLILITLLAAISLSSSPNLPSPPSLPQQLPSPPYPSISRPRGLYVAQRRLPTGLARPRTGRTEGWSFKQTSFASKSNQRPH